MVSDLPTSDPPHSFHGIEFRRIGREENAHQAVSVAGEKVGQLLGFVPTDIVQNKVCLSLRMLEKRMEEVAEGFGIECGGLFSEKASCFQVECSKVAHLRACRSREHTRLLPLGGPHSYQTAVPLEMHFVLTPELNIGIVHPLVEVFLNASC